jgi:leucyl/phenylalanyl-tRNA---protein transferase
MTAQSFDLTPEILLQAYAAGLFPMAEDADDPGLFWVEPQQRGILPLDSFHVSTRLAKTVRAQNYTIKIDHDFDTVIAACASEKPNREKTWINQRIRELYGELFALKQCHTLEVYDESGLIGGLYGVRLGAVFFGESMFHTQRDASKIALVHLAALLKNGGFTLLDTQFVTPHLAQFGAKEVPRRLYKRLLKEALKSEARWSHTPLTGEQAMAILAQN